MGEKIWTMDYGHMDFRNQSSNPPTQDTKYPVASITKVFTVRSVIEVFVPKGPKSSFPTAFLLSVDAVYTRH